MTYSARSYDDRQALLAVDERLTDMRDRRLPNWGRWCMGQFKEEGPSGYSMTPTYEMGPDGDPDGYGEIGAATVIAPQLLEAIPEPIEVDWFDAEHVDFRVAQTGPRNVLILRGQYIYGKKIARQYLNDAVIAVLNTKIDNIRVLQKLRSLGV